MEHSNDCVTAAFCAKTCIIKSVTSLTHGQIKRVPKSASTNGGALLLPVEDRSGKRPTPGRHWGAVHRLPGPP
eukprot:2127855-Amphidinium_carterae.1